MEKIIDRSSLSKQDKGRGELNVYLVYAILVVTAIIFMVLIREIK